MQLEELQQWIQDNLLNKNNALNNNKIRYNGKWIQDKHPQIYSQIFNHTQHLQDKVTLPERLYNLSNNITTIVLCKQCQIPVKFKNYKKGYNIYCSNSCAVSDNDRVVKIKNTKQIKYGDSFYNNRTKCVKTLEQKTEEEKKQTLQKYKDTSFSIYGTTHPMQNKTVQNKTKATVRNTYGVDNISNCLDIQQKKEKTNLKKFIKHTLSPVLKDIVKNTNLQILKCNVKHRNQYIILKCPEGHIFNRTSDNLKYYKECPICSNIYSNGEIEIYNWLKNEYKGEIAQSYRLYDNGNDNKKSFIELDLYLPDERIAIEFNGLYWHSEANSKNKNYHLNKTNICNNKGIQLLHIFEDEWKYKQEIVKSIILSTLGIYKEKYDAKKCHIKEVDDKTKNQFLEENHLQGTDKSFINIGLFFKDSLLSVMIFAKNKEQYELIRHCNKIKTDIIGGTNKIFNYFINSYDYNEVVAYIDRRYENGKIYENVGLKLSHLSEPNYFYIYTNNIQGRENKVSNLTEHENMLQNGYSKIWDCGNFVYKYKYKYK